MKAILGFVLATLTASTVFAGPLSRFTDRQLLNELGNRGYTCDMQQRDSAVVLITCDQNTYMNIELYTQVGQKITAMKVYMSSDSRCANEKSRLMAKTDSGRIYDEKVI